MISSEPRPNVLVEFVMNVSITASSTPAWANLMTSATGLVALMLAGSGFSSKAAGTASAFPAGAEGAAESAGAGVALASGTAGSAKATVTRLSGDLAVCWSHPATNGISAAISPK